MTVTAIKYEVPVIGYILYVHKIISSANDLMYHCLVQTGMLKRQNQPMGSK